MSSYLRRVRVSVGQPGQRGVLFEGLKTSFRVSRTIDREPNKCEISVHNLIPESVRLFQEEGAVIVLEAGHGDTVDTLFLGDIDRAVVTSRGTDRVLQIEASDGGRKLRGAEITESFGRGTSLQTVFDALANSLGVPIGPASRIPRIDIARGIVLSGPVRDALDLVTRSVGLVWSVQDDELVVVARDPVGAVIAGLLSDTRESAPLVSPASGLIGSPRQTEEGVEVETLIDGRLRPGRRFVLESRDLSGVYRASEVEHIGDSFGEQAYYTRVTAEVAE